MAPSAIGVDAGRVSYRSVIDDRLTTLGIIDKACQVSRVAVASVNLIPRRRVEHLLGAAQDCSGFSEEVNRVAKYSRGMYSADTLWFYFRVIIRETTGRRYFPRGEPRNAVIDQPRQLL